MANKRKKGGANNADKIKQAEDKIRELINWVEVLNKEELVEGEGKKIEDDAAVELKAKLQELATLIGSL